MSRRKKSNPMKWWVPVLFIVILVIGATFYMIHDMKTKIEEGQTADKETSQEDRLENEAAENQAKNTSNKAENNAAANTSTNATNVVENKAAANITANTAEKPEAKTADVQETNQAAGASSSHVSETDKTQKAIELVQKEWGEDDTVDFALDYVNENGEYIISVKDKASATAKNYFRVNVENGTVELE